MTLKNSQKYILPFNAFFLIRTLELVSKLKKFRIALLIGILSVAISANSQVSNISIRFNNPSYDCENKVYCIAVEYTTDMPTDTMYGTNVRFFYNENVLTFKEFKDFAPDYGLTNEIEMVTGALSSGSSLFNFPNGEAATWVNAGIQLKNQDAGVAMEQGSHTKYFTVCFDVDGNPEGIEDFCPEMIWDLEEDRTKGGFFGGSDGVVVTLKGGTQSIIANEIVEHFNWNYSGQGDAPYGDYTQTNGGCITDNCPICNAPSTAPILKGNQ